MARNRYSFNCCYSKTICRCNHWYNQNNIPSRIAFAVSSQTDSRTIIGSGGAEKLLGKGDMLYVGNGESAQTRVQGAFLSDQEVQDVVNYVVEQQKQIM